MKKYTVFVYTKESRIIEVEAKNEKEAIEEAKYDLDDYKQKDVHEIECEVMERKS